MSFRFAQRELNDRESRLLTVVHNTPRCTIEKAAEKSGAPKEAVRVDVARLSNMGLMTCFRGHEISVTEDGTKRLLRLGLARRAPTYVPKRLRAPVPDGCRFSSSCHRPSRAAYALCRTCENLRRADEQRQSGMTEHQQRMLDEIERCPGMTRVQIIRMFGGGTAAEKRLGALVTKGKAYRTKPAHLTPRQWRYYPI